MAMTVIKIPKPALLIPTSSIPKRDENGAKKDKENPKMVLMRKRTGKVGMRNTYRTLSFTLLFFTKYHDPNN